MVSKIERGSIINTYFARSIIAKQLPVVWTAAIEYMFPLSRLPQTTVVGLPVRWDFSLPHDEQPKVTFLGRIVK